MQNDRTNAGKIIVIDLETTGLYPAHGDRIVEIGAVPVIGNEVLVSKGFETFVDPGVPIPPHITKITSITDEMVRGAPPIEDVLPLFIAYIEDFPLVAHNAPFDIGFLQLYIKKLGLKPLTNKVIDTIILSKQIFYESSRHNMDAVLRRLGIEYDKSRRHRSMEDAYLTALSYVRLRGML
ncbi:MAG TPA: 3'-5' exonuclease [Spirochaetota bacterium]|nr:3'-5' exonuclease [Spirochaetota bacterium]